MRTSKKPFVIFSLIFYLLIALISITAYIISARQLNHSFIGQQLSLASETIQLRLASIVNSELALVRKLADTPVIRQYFLNPHDPELETSARDEFYEYQEHFNLKVVFWVNDVDKIFYSSGNEPYIVDPDDPESYWYNLTLYKTERYNFNINYNPHMEQINLWINVPVFHKDENGMSYPLGMLGTGIDLTEFSDFIINAYKDFNENITPYTFNKFNEITSAANYNLVFNKVRLNEYMGENGAQILEIAHTLGEGENLSFVLDNKIFLISSIPEMEWFLFVYYPQPGLLAVNQSMNAVFFSMLFLILLILIIINVYIARSETVLEKQNAQLLVASRAKSDFLAAMSHELRTPLNTIIGFSQIELNKSLMEESKDNAARIHQSGLHLLRIINDILDLSKLDSGKFEINPDEYDTASMISGTVDMNMIRIGSKFVKFVLEIGEDFPAKLIGDELRIKQIINNLLSNAIKYTKEGTVKFAIKHKNIDDNHVLVTFAVSDTGIGIRAEDIGKLFADYTQLDTRANREVEGTGLGLSISRKISQMMGGDITVESEYGKGSCFSADIIQERINGTLRETPIGAETAAALRQCQYITLAGGKAKTAEEKDSNEGALAAQLPAYSQFTVLAVDDHLNNLLLIREQLKPYGMKVDTASSGQEAIEKTKGETCYDLILMDHMMPGMDGIETMKAVKSDDRYAKIPIIVLTANALRGMREYYLEQGFADFISKPVDSQALKEAIGKHLTKKSELVIEEGKTSEVFSNEIVKHRTMLLHRIDMLNHICAAFEISAHNEASGKAIDDEYFRRLTDLLDSLNVISLPKPLLEQSTMLINAAHRKDTQTIRSMLRPCCKEFFLWIESHAQVQPAAADIVQRLQKAIIDGDTETTGKTVKELGTLTLTSIEREMYFNIYDALMDDNNEKALERIKEWLK